MYVNVARLGFEGVGIMVLVFVSKLTEVLRDSLVGNSRTVMNLIIVKCTNTLL